MTAKKIAPDLIDELGKVKAKLAALSARETEIVDCLKQAGPHVYEGNLFEANVFPSSHTKFDRKLCVQEHPKLAKILAKYTETKESLTCKVQAKVQR